MENNKLNTSTIGLGLLLLTAPFTSSFSGSANCIDTQTGENVWIQIDSNTSRGIQVDITVDTNEGRKLSGTFYNLNQFWDGHNLGILTGEAISIIYMDNYGIKSIQQVNAYVALNGSKYPGQGWIKSFNFNHCQISM